MITTHDEYNSYLSLINNPNPPVYAMIPSAENIYNIDINTREIDAPKFLAVEKDHKSETIYFIIDRYAGYMDLSTTCCLITYTNLAAKITRHYYVPFYDIYTYAKDNKMLLPWCLDANVARKPGMVEFSIQFYKIGEVLDEENGGMKKILSYNLNTIPARSKILAGMEVSEMSSNYLLDATQFEVLNSRIQAIEEPSPLYWTII